ncbi:MAG: polyhydroxyalkanoate synthesis repressor PhaR [Hyphomicrobiales bacterium]|nr:polyhydroxyalkanoate synthesis repressor PhaR [Hyphomicrobiales bacterium]MDE2115173.1 polyhydroxyalkanoate synthesis repressor PhaR [Hyphomicrobiales bacterium]
MSKEKTVVTIKKYANRRLYNTGSSTYVTLEDLAEMVKSGDEFTVVDAKTSEDITRSVLAQIIFEQEGKSGQSLLPISFLRQLIGFYGDSMQMIVPTYLEFTIGKLVSDQQKFRDQMQAAFQTQALGQPSIKMFGAMEEQTRKNMHLFSQALAMFSPFNAPGNVMGAASTPEPAEPKASQGDDIEKMREEVRNMQRRLDGLTGKS